MWIYKKAEPLALLDARGPELRQLRLRATIGGWERASRRTERRGCRGMGAVRSLGEYGLCAVTLHCTSVYVRDLIAANIEWRSPLKAGVGASADCNRKQRECGAFPHPSALASGLVKPPGYPSRSCPHAAPFDRIRLGGPWDGYPTSPALPRPRQHHQHGSIHGNIARTV